MRIIDNHCDVLSKMLSNHQIHLDSGHLDVTLERLRNVDMLVQSFAIYITEKIQNPNFDHILQSIDLFHQRILYTDEFLFIQTSEDLKTLIHSKKMGALLTLEGADALESNWDYLRTMHQLGVRCVGITWNYANWAADGVLEPRQGGLTIKGKKLVQACNQMGMILDCSHLAEKGFWELHDLSSKPYMASHSNAYEQCQHPRNLKDEQIKAIISKNGFMGLTFVPFFINNKGEAKMIDLLRHIDHIFSIGGKQHIGWGSDFDGINQWVGGLEHTGRFYDLENMLNKYYHSEEVEGLMWKNAFNFYVQNLPHSSLKI